MQPLRATTIIPSEYANAIIYTAVVWFNQKGYGYGHFGASTYLARFFWLRILKLTIKIRH